MSQCKAHLGGRLIMNYSPYRAICFLIMGIFRKFVTFCGPLEPRAGIHAVEQEGPAMGGAQAQARRHEQARRPGQREIGACTAARAQRCTSAMHFSTAALVLCSHRRWTLGFARGRSRRVSTTIPSSSPRSTRLLVLQVRCLLIARPAEPITQRAAACLPAMFLRMVVDV